MIQVHLTDGDPVYLNPAHIERIEPYIGYTYRGSTIVFATATLVVRESPDELVTLIAAGAGYR